MNLLIVADRSDVKLYQSIAKTAPNVSVLGAVTKIDKDFIATVRDKYNPHAIMIDTETPAIGADIKTVIEKIPPEYSYMKILVLTSEDDDYDYPVDCVVQGQVSNIKLKEILTSMANGSALPDSEPLDDEKEQEGSRLPRRIKLNSRELDKLSASSMTNRRFGFKSIHINPIILAGAAAGVLVIVVIVLAVMKGMSGAGQAATSDEAATTAPFFLFDTQPSAEPTTEDYTYPTLPIESYTTATVPTTAVPPTIAPEPTAAPQTVPATTHSEEKPTAAPQTGNSSSGGISSSGSRNSNSGDNSSSSSGNSSGPQSSQPETKVYGGDPVVSYDDNGRYSNSGGNAVSEVKLNYSSKTIQVDDTLQLTATISPSNANQSVTWSSSNSSVVSVSNGKLTAKKVGKATVTATANNGKSASCEVTVKSRAQTDNVHLSATAYHISVGQTITVTLYGADNVTWSASNSNPVTLSSRKNTVTVKARRKGKTQIYAKDNGTGKVYICDVYVE